MVPDYYAMLGVEPGADRSVLAEALARHQPVWSSGTRNPKTKHTYQSYLDQIPSLRQALLGDASSRAAYDAELAAAARAQREERLDALQKLVRLRAAKGGLTTADLEGLRDKALELGLSPVDLDRLAGSIPRKLEERTDDDGPDLPVDVLDPVMRRQIRVALDHLRRRDLYDALELPRDAPVEEIVARADAERQRWMRKTQVTAEKTAWLEVVTLAQSHLTAAAVRARYDRTLVRESEDRFISAVAFSLAGLTRLDGGTHEVLLGEAAAVGIDPERAERLISRCCTERGVSREAVSSLGRASSNGHSRLLRCRRCSGLTELATVAKSKPPGICPRCAATLDWSCPSCRKKSWVDQPRCGCGFRIEHVEPLVRHFEAAQEAYRVQEYSTALVHLSRVREFAPSHVGARKGIEKVRERLAEIDRAKSDWERARAERRLVAGKAAVEAWGRLTEMSAPEWRSAWAEVTGGLRDASALVARAKERERVDPKAARDLYRKSLALAADLPAAITGLSRCPPDPPSDLEAALVVDRVRLRWTAPPPDGLGPVTFVVRRKADAALAHPADGLEIGESAEPEFEDREATPGTSVAYAVSSRRGGVVSMGAVAVGPMFLVAEVRNLKLETRHREVELSWTPPRNASEIRVLRKRGGPPTGPLDGERVDALADQAHDRGLEPDRVYHYGVFVVYRTPDGRAVASRGVFISAQAHTQVSPLAAPVLETEADDRVSLRWVEPPRGIVKIMRTFEPFPHPVGARLTPLDLDSLVGEWLDLSTSNPTRDSPPLVPICYYTPLNSWGGTATVGHSTAHARVADPTDLRASSAGNGRVNLRWSWSPRAHRALVVFRSGSPPTDAVDPLAKREIVVESDYARLGRHTITLPPDGPGPWHVVVYGLSGVEDQQITSPGLEPSARTIVPGSHPVVTVSYSIKRRLLGLGGHQVTFHTEPPGQSVPPTVLVANSRTLPLSADDGAVVAALPATRDGARFFLPRVMKLSGQRARVFADPRSEPEANGPIRIEHPGAEETRV